MASRKRHPLKSRGVVSGYPPISGVLAVLGLSEVADPVIRPVAVYVVDLVFGKLAEDVQPGKSMRQSWLAFYADGPVTVRPQAASYVASHGSLASPDFIGEDPGVRIVEEGGSEVFASNHEIYRPIKTELYHV